MKILIATGIFPPDIGGPATYSQLLSDELKKRGIRVVVVSFGLVRNISKLIRHFIYFAKVYVAGKDVDVIFAQDPVSVGLPALLAAKVLGKRFIVRVAGDYAWEQGVQRFKVNDSIDIFQGKRYGVRVELMRMIQRLVVRNADTVIAPSHYFKGLVKGWTGGQKEVVTIYNGVQLQKRGLDKAAARKQLGLPLDVNLLLTAGRLVPWKGFLGLIETMEAFKGKKPYTRLIIVGDGPERDVLARAVSEKGLGEHVTLVGSQSRDVLAMYLWAADLFILNTAFESFSYVIVEAMAAGVPVITTRIGNLEEILTDKKEGLLVSWNDREQILTSINTILSQPEQREQMIINAQRKARQFSIDHTVDQIFKILT